MTIRGHVENGVAVPDDGGALPEGAQVDIVVLADAAAARDEPSAFDSLSEFFREWAGSLEGLPDDFAENHDQYIHGTARRAPRMPS